MADKENCEQPNSNNSQNTTPPLDPNNPYIIRPERNMPQEKSAKGSYNVTGFPQSSKKKMKSLGSFNSTSKSYEEIYAESVLSQKNSPDIKEFYKRDEKDSESIGETYDADGKRFVQIKETQNRKNKDDKDVIVPQTKKFKHQEFEENVIHRTKEENTVEIEFDRPQKLREETLNTNREQKLNTDVSIETNRVSKFNESNLDTDRTSKTENSVSASTDASPKIINEHETKFSAPTTHSKLEENVSTPPYIENYKIFNAENITTNTPLGSPKTEESLPANLDPGINKSEEEFPITVTGLKKTEESFPTNLDPGIEKSEEDLGVRDPGIEKSEEDLGVKDPGLKKDENTIPVRDPGIEKTEEDLGVKDPGIEKSEEDLGVKDPGIEKTEEDLGVKDPGLKKEEVVVTDKENPNSETEQNKAEYFNDADQIDSSSVVYEGKNGYRINILRESSNTVRNETVKKVGDDGETISWEDGLESPAFDDTNTPVSSINTDGVGVNKNVDYGQQNSQYRYGSGVRYEKYDANLEGYSQSSQYWRELPGRERIYNSGVDNVIGAKQGVETRNSNTDYTEDGLWVKNVERSDGSTGGLMIWTNYENPGTTNPEIISNFESPKEFTSDFVNSNFNYSDRQYTYHSKLDFDGEGVDWNNYKKDFSQPDGTYDPILSTNKDEVSILNRNTDYSILPIEVNRKYDGVEEKEVVWDNYNKENVENNTMDIISSIDEIGIGLDKNTDYSSFERDRYTKLDASKEDLDDIVWTNYDLSGVEKFDIIGDTQFISSIDVDGSQIINKNIEYVSFEGRQTLDDSTHESITSSSKEESYNKQPASIYDDGETTSPTGRRLNINLLSNFDYSNIDSSSAETKWDGTSEDDSIDDIDMSRYTQNIPDDTEGLVSNIVTSSPKDWDALNKAQRSGLNLSYKTIFDEYDTVDRVAIKNSIYKTDVRPDLDIELSNLGSPVDFYGENDWSFDFKEERRPSRDIVPGDGVGGGTQVLRNLMSASGVSSALSSVSNIVNNFGDLVSLLNGGEKNFAAELNNDYLNVLRRTMTSELPSILMSFKRDFDVMGAGENGQMLENFLDSVSGFGDLVNTTGNIMNHPGAAIANMLRGDGTLGNIFLGGREDAVNILTQGTSGRHGGLAQEDFVGNLTDNRFNDYDINDSFATGSDYWNVTTDDPLSLNMDFGGLFGSEQSILYNKDLVRNLAQSKIGQPNFTTRSMFEQLGTSLEAVHKGLLSSYTGIYEEQRDERTGFSPSGFNINSNRAGEFFGVRSGSGDGSQRTNFTFGSTAERQSTDYRYKSLNRRLFSDEIEGFNPQRTNREVFDFIETNYNNELQTELFEYDFNYLRGVNSLFSINIENDDWYKNENSEHYTSMLYDTSRSRDSFYTNNFLNEQSTMSYSDTESSSINLNPFYIDGSILGQDDYDPHLVFYNIPLQDTLRNDSAGRYLGSRGILRSLYENSDNVLFLTNSLLSNEGIKEKVFDNYEDRINYVPVNYPSENKFYSLSLQKFFNPNEYISYNEQVDPHLKEVSINQDGLFIVNNGEGPSSQFGGKDLFYRLNEGLLLAPYSIQGGEESLVRGEVYGVLNSFRDNDDYSDISRTEISTFFQNPRSSTTTNHLLFNLIGDSEAEPTTDPHFITTSPPNERAEISKYLGLRGKLKQYAEEDPNSNIFFFDNLEDSINRISSGIGNSDLDKKHYIATDSSILYNNINFYNDWVSRPENMELSSHTLNNSDSSDPHLISYDRTYNVVSKNGDDSDFQNNRVSDEGKISFSNFGGKAKFLDVLNHGDKYNFTLFPITDYNLEDGHVKSIFGSRSDGFYVGDENISYITDEHNNNGPSRKDISNFIPKWSAPEGDEGILWNWFTSKEGKEEDLNIGNSFLLEHGGPKYKLIYNSGTSNNGVGFTLDSLFVDPQTGVPNGEGGTGLQANGSLYSDSSGLYTTSFRDVPITDVSRNSFIDGDTDRVNINYIVAQSNYEKAYPNDTIDEDLFVFNETEERWETNKLNQMDVKFADISEKLSSSSGQHDQTLWPIMSSIGPISDEIYSTLNIAKNEENIRSKKRPVAIKKFQYFNEGAMPGDVQSIDNILGADNVATRMDVTDLDARGVVLRGVNERPGTRENLLANINLKFKKSSTSRSHFQPLDDYGNPIDSSVQDHGEGYIAALSDIDKSISNDAVFYIPFQFQAEINGEQRAADWASETAVGRTSEFYIWSKTNARTIQLKTTYLSVAPDWSFTPDANFQSMAIWTPTEINKIVNKYRSLLLPLSNTISSALPVSPPVIVLVLNNYLLTTSNASVKRLSRWFVQDVNIDAKYEYGQTETRDPMGFDITMTLKEVFAWKDIQSWGSISSGMELT